MTHESASRRLWQLITIGLLPIIILNTIHGVYPTHGSSIIQLYETLVSFAARGQTTIELFPPWSVIVSSSTNGRAFLTVASLIAWTLIGASFGRLLQARSSVSSDLLILQAIYALLSGVVWILSLDRHENDLFLV
jgi:hypothetical protein